MDSQDMSDWLKSDDGENFTRLEEWEWCGWTLDYDALSFFPTIEAELDRLDKIIASDALADHCTRRAESGYAQ